MLDCYSFAFPDRYRGLAKQRTHPQHVKCESRKEDKHSVRAERLDGEVPVDRDEAGATALSCGCSLPVHPERMGRSSWTGTQTFSIGSCALLGQVAWQHAD